MGWALAIVHTCSCRSNSSDRFSLRFDWRRNKFNKERKIWYDTRVQQLNRPLGMWELRLRTAIEINEQQLKTIFLNNNSFTWAHIDMYKFKLTYIEVQGPIYLLQASRRRCKLGLSWETDINKHRPTLPLIRHVWCSLCQLSSSHVS